MASVLSLAFTALGVLFAGFGGFYAFLVSFMRASRKGYVPAALAAIVLATMLVGCAGFFALVAVSPSLDGRITAILAPVFFLMVPSIALSLLPRRPPRRIFSVKRVAFPYSRIGHFIFVTGCCVTVVVAPLAWWTGGPVWLSLAILLVGPLLSLVFKQLFVEVLGEPVRAVPSFADLLAADPRPPVVYMRPFEREGQPFVWDTFTKYGRYSEKPRFSSKQVYVSLPLDEYLRGAVTSQIGPFLALGNPQDYFTPAGAVRTYFKDDQWMKEFGELAQRAACLLVEAGESSNLRWELQYLRRSNLHHKVIVVTCHRSNPYGSFWLRLASRMAGIPQVTWESFSNAAHRTWL